MNQAQVISIRKFFEVEQMRLGIGGFYPNRIQRTLLVKLATILTYFVTLSQVAAAIAFAITSNDLSKITECFLFLLTQIVFLNKLVNFHLKFERVIKLDECISREIFTRVTLEEQEFFERAFRKLQWALNAFCGACIITVVMYGIFPALKNAEGGPLNYPLPGKFPFNPDKVYYIIYVAEVFAVGVSAWNNSALDCLFTKHAVAAATLFKILCRKIERVMDDADNEETLADRIKHCIIYYNEITGYVNMVEKIFSCGFLMQIMCSALVICFTGFQMIVVISLLSAEFLTMLFYLLSMVFQISLYCFHGHMLMEASDDIARACYWSKWYEMKVKERKMLITTMERAKKPVTLRAAGLFSLNLSTFMSIMRSSYSTFALLRQIYKK